MSTNNNPAQRILSAASDLSDLALYLSGVPHDIHAVDSLVRTARQLHGIAEVYASVELADLATSVLALARQDLSNWSTVSDLDSVVTRVQTLAERLVDTATPGAAPGLPYDATSRGWVHGALTSR